MDLSFTRFVADADATPMPADLAVLMVGVAARAAASPTAAAQAGLARGVPAPQPFAPRNGAFHAPTAAALTRWKDQ